MSDPIVGIDLGTSNSVVAYADELGNARVLPDEGGYKIHPSVVSFHPNGGVVVGAAAKQRKVIDPANTIYSVKRLIGRAYSSPEVKTAKKRSPFQIKEGANELPLIVTRSGEFAVPEISAIVLDHVRNIAQHQLGEQVSRAVVTVPASFNDAQRSATATAGAIAGLTVVRVLNEPTAAALAYGNTRNLKQTIAVYDFGGGTFDITILKLHDQVYEVLGTAGDTFLGGDDLDERLVDKMVGKFLQENRIDLRSNEVSMMRLRAVAEQTKIELSRRSRAVVRVDEIAYGPKGAPLNLQIEITRDEFVTQVADIIDRTFPVCKEALSYAGLGIDKVDDVILVGGTTKIPYVRDQVGKFFGKPARTDVNPEDAVAVGASLQATSLQRILSRPSSKSVPIPVPEDDDAFDGETNTVDNLQVGRGVEMDDEETNVSDASQLKPDTSYSLPRTGTREVFEGKTPPPQSAIGRLKPMPRSTDKGVPTAAPQSKTMVAEAPRAPTPPPVPGKVPTQRGMPAAPKPENLWGSAADFETSPAAQQPTVVIDDSGLKPMPTASPQATTLMSSSPPPPTQYVAEQSPASTAKGFAPPQPFQVTQPLPPVSRPPQPPHQAATQMAMQPPPYPAPTSQPPPYPAPAQPPIYPPQPPPPPHQAATQMAMQPPAYPTPPAPPPPYPGQPSQAATQLAMQPPAYPAPAAPPFAMPMMPQAPAYEPPPPAPEPVYRPPPVVLDVTPRSLGIATVAGYCEELIRRNSRLPTEMVKLFTTSRDKQNAVHIVVCQGESRRLDNNTVIGELRLEGIPARPRGETSIEVTFSLDASGILQVSARDAQTGREQTARLDLVGSVPGEDVAASRERVQQLRR